MRSQNIFAFLLGFLVWRCHFVLLYVSTANPLRGGRANFAAHLGESSRLSRALMALPATSKCELSQNSSSCVDCVTRRNMPNSRPFPSLPRLHRHIKEKHLAASAKSIYPNQKSRYIPFIFSNKYKISRNFYKYVLPPNSTPSSQNNDPNGMQPPQVCTFLIGNDRLLKVF